MPPQPFTAAHRSYIKKLYRNALRDELDWSIDRALWRSKAVDIRVLFERNRDVQDPRALSTLLQQTADKVKARNHPDPYTPPLAPDGTKWERNIPPPMFSQQEKESALQVLRAQGLAKY